MLKSLSNKVVVQKTCKLATSKTWTRTLDLDPEKPRPRKTWTLKNLDPENLGSEKPGPRKTWILKKVDPEIHES